MFLKKLFRRRQEQPVLDYDAILEPYQEKIKATRLPYLEISVVDSEDTDPSRSHFGGLPYVPVGHSLPKTKDGAPLYLLAQLNFAEMPRLEYFPQQGLLQFWIANHDLYGSNFDDLLEQDTFRMVYYPEIQAPDLEVVPPPFDEETMLPFTHYLHNKLHFYQTTMPMTQSDYRYQQLFAKACQDEKFNMAYLEKYFITGHRVGGYPYCTQTDPREFGPQYHDKEILLLQIDSLGDIQWGDIGVANFFISKKDLINCDFSQVIYSWSG